MAIPPQEQKSRPTTGQKSSAVNMPKGGGALQGIGEKFSVNAVNGANTLAIPLPTAAARDGFSPSLSLVYSTGSGNGPFGLGWSVSIPSITRKTEKELPRYQDAEDSDTFIFADAEDLVPLLKLDPITRIWKPVVRETATHKVRQYRPRIEGVWARIEQWRNKASGEIHWRTITTENVTSFYGLDQGSRLADPADKNHRIFEWRLSHSFDDKGNLIVYRYKAEDFAGVRRAIYEERRNASTCTNLYLKKILYGNKTPYHAGDVLPPDSDFLFETVFDYGEHDLEKPLPDEDGEWASREDAFSIFRSGFDIRTYRLCQRVLLFHKFDELPINPYLVSALELGFADFPGQAPTSERLEGFTYLKQVVRRGYRFDANANTYTSKTLPPLRFAYQPHMWNTQVKSISTEDIYNAPIGLDFDKYRWIDLYSEGLSGILSETSDGWYYKRNLGGGNFTAALPVSPRPSLTGLASGSLQLQDISGAGDLYLVNLVEEPKGFFHLRDDETWQPFQPFDSVPNRDLLNDPNVRLIDLNGDGLADLLITEDELFTWHAALGEKGFGPANTIEMALDEEHGPRLVFSEALQTIYLADMNGDGLTDLARIRNGEICYWANLGHGHFSSKITMQGAPRFDHTEKFNPAFLRLADIDGSGPIDLIYLGQGDFRVWMNLSGNRWSTTPQVIPFPEIDRLTDIEALDLLGNGTAALVWSSPLPGASQAPLRYIDLMGSKKPHLLTYFENNMGSEVTFEYLPSTHYYLEDYRLGRPWVTKLPFPVHVVARVIVADRVRETIFTTTYSYHHGYYDGMEREFRGFGRVEQVDTEAFSVFKLSGAQNVVEEALHQPPVRSVSWYHTGAALQNRQLTDRYEAEYYQNPHLQEHLLPPLRLPSGLDDGEWTEALRSCKGLTLRQEVYAQDGSLLQDQPYSTHQASFEVHLVQPRLGQKHACFQVVASERISYAYDRRPADPRIVHSLTLETDDRGLTTRSAAVVYPRRLRPPGLPDAVWNEQNLRHVVVSETQYTADIDLADAYRLRTEFESRAFELLGIPLPTGQFLTIQNLKDFTQAATPIPFEDDGDGTLQKRLISQGRVYFLANNLQGGLPLGQRQSLGLVYRTMRLAFTPGLIARYYNGKVTDGMLAQAGFEHSQGDNDWWIPSGIYLYPANPADHFFIPIGVRDALGSETLTVFDGYTLLPEQSSDALGNTTILQNDYRTLAPALITDANLNRAAVETDELGLVIRTALMGKAGLNEGDTLADPTSRLEYDFFNWMDRQKPNYIHTFARERHGAGNPRWQESYAYADGSGNILLSKIQAEPGLAKRWNPLSGQVDEIHTNDRWIGNGRVILNNKGNPIKQYEPYFSVTHEFEKEPELVETGSTPVLYYDPVGRNTRTDLPNGTFTKAEFDPWAAQAYDPNDTVRDSQWYADRGSPDPLVDPEPLDAEQRAAWLAARHHKTPSGIITDSLGRTVYAISDYGNGKTTGVRTERDLTGRYVRMFDELERQISLAVANLNGAPMYAESAEKGKRWVFQDILGRMVRLWDNDEREFRTTYDQLHRPVSTFVAENGAEMLFNHIVYGEHHPNAQALNLISAAYQIYDQAGVTTMKRIDFKGNPLEVERRLARDYTQTVNWQALENLTDIVAIANAANPLLEAESFSSQSTYDALNRPIQVIMADGTVIRPKYNPANYLDSLEAQMRGQGNFITFLENQDHNARGQRALAKLGNGAITRLFYDPASFRLTQLLTTRQENDPPAAALQNIHYTYDPVGNLTQVVDKAQQTHFFSNQVVHSENKYEYDALYQLVRASGREHAGLGGNLQSDHTDLPIIQQLPHNNNANAVRTYTETYVYDDLGNILSLRHQTSDGLGDWTRRYRYIYQDNPADRTNRLASTSLPGDPVGGPFSAVYSHDNHGNMTSTPHLAQMAWNFMDQLRKVDLGGGGLAYYVYSGGGERMRKVIERNGGRRIEHIYMGAIEVRRERNGNVAPHYERWTTHITDDSGRIAQIDIKTIDLNNQDPANALNTPLIRYQYTNHIGSATLETNQAGEVISYEEYHPFGTTAYHSSRPGFDLSLKRYRFSGKERDDESGMYYFGARFYMAWLGRWTSSDVAGFTSGFNLYRYCSNNPVMMRDSKGMQGSYSIPYEFTGNESLDQLRQILWAHGRVMAEPEINEQNYRSRYTPGPGPGGSGGTWRFNARLIRQDETYESVYVPPIRPAITAVQEAARPTAATTPTQVARTRVGQPRSFTPGEPLSGPYNLWSNEPGGGLLDAAKAPGFIMEDTAFEELAEATARRLGYSGRYDPKITPDHFREIWEPTSDALATRAGLTQMTVTSNGLEPTRTPAHPNPGGTVQASREIPRIQLAGGLMAQLGKINAIFTFAASSQIDNPYIRTIGYTSAATEFVAGNAYLIGSASLGSGYFSASTTSGLMTFGRLGGRIGGGVGVIALSGYAFYNDYQNENYGVLLGDGAGVGAGVCILAGSGPGAAIFTGVAVTNIAGDWVESKVTPRAGRGWGVAAGTGTGAAAGAAIGAGIGVWFFGVGAAPGALIGGAIGGIAGFIGAYW